MTDEEIILQWLTKIKNELSSKLPKVTGKTEGSLRIEMGRGSGMLLAAKYIYALETGRGPTLNGRGEGETLQKKLLRWISDKSIIPKANAKGKIPTLEQLSWAMAMKIHKEGNLLYRRGGKSGVLSTTITQERIDALTKVFGNKYRAEIGGSLVSKTKEAFKEK